MIEKRRSNRLAFLAAITVFIIFVGVVLYLWGSIDFSEINLIDTLFAMTMIVGAFLTVIVFQSFRVQDDAKVLAAGIAKDMFLSSRELFSELYRGSPVPYVLINASGNIDSMNASAIRLFRTQEGLLDGKNIFDYIEGDDEVKVGMYPEKLKQGLFVNDEEARVIRSDGEKRWVLLSLFSFTDPRGRRSGLLTLVDISKQKEIDRAKTEFVSLASHQLRTPITAMKWNMELLFAKHATEWNEKERDLLTKIYNNIGRMNMLVDDFLNASKFELGTLVPEFTKVDVQAFFKDMLEEHLERARLKQIPLEVRLDSDVPEFTTDSHLLHMILSNLVSNAIKYTGQGGRVAVTMGHDSSTVTFSIADTGMGIPEEDQDKIFSKIFRASNARKNVPDGTGLGLYIADQAAKVLGGSITMLSRENQGTVFTVALPRK